MMTRFFFNTVGAPVPFVLAALLVLFPPVAGAQTEAANTATSETLNQLLPEPPEGFERAVSPTAEGKRGPWAQAMYVFEGDRYRAGADGSTRILDHDGGEQVAFEVEISSVTEEEKAQVLGRMEEAHPTFEISTDRHGEHEVHLITGGGKSYLYLFTSSFQVYMEGNAAPVHLREALHSIDVGALSQYTSERGR